jgi:hypothetical protein
MYLNFDEVEAGAVTGVAGEGGDGDWGGGDDGTSKITAPAAISRLTVIINTVFAGRRNLYPHFSQ